MAGSWWKVTIALVLGLTGGTAAAADPSDTPLATVGAGSGPLEPGVHGIDLDRILQTGTQLPALMVTVPEGWSHIDHWALLGSDEAAVGVAFWDVGQVYGHPCQWQGTLFDPGDGVDELAATPADIPLRAATTPGAVELGGRSGIYLEWSVPKDADFAECDTDGGYAFFESWTGAHGGDRYQQEPGQIDRLWILDIDGHRLVIDAFNSPSATPAQLMELEAVLASALFETSAPIATDSSTSE